MVNAMPAGVPNLGQMAPIAAQSGYTDAAINANNTAKNAVQAELQGIQAAVDKNVQMATPDLGFNPANANLGGQPTKDTFVPSTAATVPNGLPS